MPASPITAARAAVRQRIIDVAARIIVLRLDKENVEGSPEDLEREAEAERLFEEYPESVVERGRQFVEYVVALRPEACATCGGNGAYKVAPQCACGAALPLKGQTACAECQEAGQPGDPNAKPRYLICNCVHDAAQAARSGERGRPYVTQTTQPPDASAIAKLERERAEVQAAIAEACTDVDRKIAATKRELDDYNVVWRTRRSEVEMRENGRMLEELRAARLAQIWEERIAEKTRELEALHAQAVKENAASAVLVAERKEQEANARANVEEIEKITAPFEATLGQLEAKRKRIAGRFDRRLAGIEKRLRRLRYLAGEASTDEAPAPAETAPTTDSAL